MFEDLFGFMLRFFYMGIWVLAWYIAVCLTATIVRYSIRVKTMPNLKMNSTILMFGGLVTLFLICVLIGVSKLWPDSIYYQFPLLVAPGLVLLMMFIKANIKILDIRLEEDRIANDQRKP